LPQVTKTRRSAKSTSKAKNPSDAATDRRKRSGTSGASAARTARSGASKSGARKPGAGKAELGGTKLATSKSGVSRSGINRSGVRTRSAANDPANDARHDTTNAPRSAGELDEARTLALAALEAALDKKALMPVLIDVSAMASYTDFIGIVSGRSDRQVEAIAEGVSQLMKSRGRHVFGQEGRGNGRWTLLDFGEIVIHVFYHPVREFYDLESLWIDAPRVKMAIPPEAILAQPDVLYGTL
jgi:ribosome-associated protein